MTRDERQALAVENWKIHGCRNTLECCTGFGKTRTAILAIKRVLKVKPTAIIVIVVPTKVLQEQWVIQLNDNKISATVLVINTASKKKFNCDFLIIDEIQHSASDTLRNVFNNCTPRLILGLTATYERLDGKEKEVLDKYAPICDTVTLEEALINNWVSPYREYKVLIDCDLTEYDKANSEFMQHFAFFGFDFNLAMKAVTNVIIQRVIAKQINCSEKEVKAHAHAWNRALQFRKNFIANHPKKLQIAEYILSKRKNSKAITFNTSIKQCESYKSGYVIHSKQAKKENKEIIEKFNKTSFGVIHSAKSLIEGVDIPGLNLGIITGFNSSQINKRQSRGRVIRFEKGKQAEIFTLVLKGTQEEKWYQKANEGSFYIEINEQELELVLNNQPLINKENKIQEKCNNNLLRY